MKYRFLVTDCDQAIYIGYDKNAALARLRERREVYDKARRHYVQMYELIPVEDDNEC